MEKKLKYTFELKKIKNTLWINRWKLWIRSDVYISNNTRISISTVTNTTQEVLSESKLLQKNRAGFLYNARLIVWWQKHLFYAKSKENNKTWVFFSNITLFMTVFDRQVSRSKLNKDQKLQITNRTFFCYLPSTVL